MNGFLLKALDTHTNTTPLTFRTLKHFFFSGIETRSAYILAAIFFRIILEIGYLTYVNPFHAYRGFVLTLDSIKYVESWFIFLVLTVLAPCRLTKPSDFFLIILLFGLMVPLLSFYALADQPRQYIYIVILGYVLIDLFRRGRPFRFPTLYEGRLLAFILVILGVAGVTAWLLFSGGFSFFNLNLTEVYQYRRAVGAIINAGVMGYINVWTWKVFGPALLTIGLWRKKYWLAAFVIGLHVYWFGVSAHKSVLFYPLLPIFIWLFFRHRSALIIVPIGAAGIVVASLLFFFILDYGLPSSLFIRRIFYVIANNTFDYYEFFNNHSWVWWSNTSFSLGLQNYPYDLNPAELIGHWRGTENHVNSTFLSTGYMHAGIYGIVLYGVLTGLLFRFIDSLASKGLPHWIVLGILVVPCQTLLLSADLPTSLLTHGFGIGILIIFLMRKSIIDKQSRENTKLKY